MSSATTASESVDFPIAIIGAGFAGIGMGVQLKKAGIHSFSIFERATEVGGTWRDNVYPGAACDVPSHLYCFSFEPNPRWSQTFAGSAEILAYLKGVVDKWKLRPQIRLDTEIVAAEYDDSAGQWRLTTASDEIVTARFVVSALGGLVNPAYPDIKGLQSFRGDLFHTARWNADSELTGKKVGVIGTGASAVQVVPEVASEVESLSVFQRTPAWVVPKMDTIYSEKTKDRLERYPWLLKASRVLRYALSELMGPMVFLDSERLSSVGERMSMKHLESSVHDDELRKKLTPDFQFGCKRILISDDYWSTFERENVHLVTDGIEEIRAEGIETKDGTLHELDAIILATGFALGLASAPFPVKGLGGQTLDEAWAKGAVAYKGMSVSGFPNWHIMMGPNTGPGHTSVILYTEAQISHAIEAIKTMRRERLKSVDIRKDVQDDYNAAIQKRMKYMVWPNCKSWYLSDDGENHALYPGLAGEYVLRARRFKRREYVTTPL